MLKLRYWFRLAIAFLARFKGLIALGIIAGVAIFFFFRFFEPFLFGGKIERIGIVGRFSTENLPNFILEMVGDGLTKIDANGNVEPSLAKSWETPDKGKTWIFHLKDGVFWQDGKPLTSKSIVYHYSDVEIQRPDDKTIIFKLKNPFSPFPSVVAKPTFKKGLLGTGDFRVSRLSLVGGYVQKLEITAKNKDREIYEFYPTEESAKLAFKLGKVGQLLSVFDPKPLDSWKTIKLQKNVSQDQYVAVFFNTQDSVLSEKSLRQALSYAINKDALAPASARVISPISPNSWAYNPQVKPYNFDQDRAKELIDSLSKEQKNNLSVKLTTTPVLLATAEKVRKDWQAVGVKTTIQVSSVVPQDYQALLAIFDTPVDPDQYAIWHSTQTDTNISRYENPRIDKLLENGRSEVNQDERRKIYLDFQRFLVEDAPASFLYHPTSYTLTRKSF